MTTATFNAICGLLLLHAGLTFAPVILSPNVLLQLQAHPAEASAIYDPQKYTGNDALFAAKMTVAWHDIDDAVKAFRTKAPGLSDAEVLDLQVHAREYFTNRYIQVSMERNKATNQAVQNLLENTPANMAVASVKIWMATLLHELPIYDEKTQQIVLKKAHEQYLENRQNEPVTDIMMLTVVQIAMEGKSDRQKNVANGVGMALSKILAFNIAEAKLHAFKWPISKASLNHLLELIRVQIDQP